MPRQARDVAAGYIYHVLNRGNRKQSVFHKEKDYIVFLDLMKKAKEKIPIKIFVSGLLGGHSGADIHLGRGNALKLIGQILWKLNKEYVINEFLYN